MNAWQASDS